jgi:hypothetical protein
VLHRVRFDFEDRTYLLDFEDRTYFPNSIRLLPDASREDLFARLSEECSIELPEPMKCTFHDENWVYCNPARPHKTTTGHPVHEYDIRRKLIILTADESWQTEDLVTRSVWKNQAILAAQQTTSGNGHQNTSKSSTSLTHGNGHQSASAFDSHVLISTETPRRKVAITTGRIHTATPASSSSLRRAVPGANLRR